MIFFVPPKKCGEDFFLVTYMQLYKRVCPSVGPSVRWSVGPSVRNAFFKKVENGSIVFWALLPLPNRTQLLVVYPALLIQDLAKLLHLIEWSRSQFALKIGDYHDEKHLYLLDYLYFLFEILNN